MLFWISNASGIWGKQLLVSDKKKEELQMAENKKRISIEVNADFHRELKLFATLRGMSIQSYITTLIQNDMKNMK